MRACARACVRAGCMWVRPISLSAELVLINNARVQEELLSAAAAECNPDPDVVWDFLQRTQDVLVAAGGLKETQDEDCRQQGLSQRLNAAFVLVRRVGELGARGASGPRGEAAQP